MITDLGLDKGDIGLIGTLFLPFLRLIEIYLRNNIGPFKPALFHGLGLIATGLINIAFGFQVRWRRLSRFGY